MKKRAIGKNLISSVISYFLVMVLNLAFAKVVMIGFGSEANGLLSTVNQIFTYIALLEAGIGLATTNALYSPIGNKDADGVAEVMQASKRYYRKASFWYFLCVVAVSTIFPLVVDSQVSYTEIFALVLFQGISGVLSFSYTSTISNYLIASGKNYVNSYVTVIVTLSTVLLKIGVCLIGKSIAFFSVATLLINICKCIFYRIYAGRLVPEFFEKRKTKQIKLPQRNAYLIHEISSVVFSSTDMLIISIFCTLAHTSVYAVYAMPFNAISTVCMQAINSLIYILGQAYVKGEYKKVHDGFNLIYTFLVFSLFTSAYLLVIPFVTLYTKGVTDINYIDERLPILFVMIQFLSSIRVVDNNLIKVAGHAKKTANRTIIETSINLVVSIVLVNLIGIYGVLIGTIVALLYRTVDIIVYANRKILNRSPLLECRIFAPNLILFGLFVVLRNKVVVNIDSVFEFITKGFLVFLVVFLSYLVCNLLVNYKMIKEMLKRGLDRKWSALRKE